MNKLYFLCGLPGSSKSTWAETHKDELSATVHSSDSIRTELGDVTNQSKNDLVFQILHKRVKEGLTAGKNVIYDATNLKRKNRLHFLKQIQNIPCEKICVLFATPIEICKRNNANRDRKVPEEVIERMYRSFKVPCYQEGWDDIQIIWWDWKSDGMKFKYMDDLIKYDTSHDNPHHKLSISVHMLRAATYYVYKCTEFVDPILSEAISMHDCGKYYVKDFKDSKGNPSDIAHYYNHENCGSYLSLFYLKDSCNEWSDNDILYISLLINLHMRPHTAWKQSDKTKEKDRRLFGDKVISDLEIIHECDKAVP